MSLLILAFISFYFTSCLASTNLSHVGSWANFSSGPLGSSQSNASLFALMARQYECSIPGGLPCPTDSFECCGPSEHCCGNPPLGCCGNSEQCFNFDTECCPNGAQTCGGTTCCQSNGVCCNASPSGCCIPGAVCCKSFTTPCCPSGSSCCGDTCCLSGEVCERGECISAQLQNKIARFFYDEQKNGALLRNMCNGMMGQNTVVLTYSGKLTDTQKRQKRTAAGCVEGYCRGLINSGVITSDLNSCDEFPFASTNQGGGTLPALQTAINCIPGFQNSHQGGVLRTMIDKAGLQAGDDFVVSVDCAEVLGGLIPRGTVSESGSGGELYNATLMGSNGTLSFIIVSFGDLLGGSFNATLQLTSGSVINATVIDNLGDTYTGPLANISAGHTQQIPFTLSDELMGVGLILVSMGNATNLTWTFQGTTIDNPTSSAPNSPLSTGLSSGSTILDGHIWASVLTAGCMLAGGYLAS